MPGRRIRSVQALAMRIAGSERRSREKTAAEDDFAVIDFVDEGNVN